MVSLDRALSEELDHLQQASLRRRPRYHELRPDAAATVEGRALLNLGSNNYLGLAGDPRVRTAAAAACERWGAGSTGSRLTSGSFALHAQLEEELAQFKSAEAALLFGSGYETAIGVIPALVGRGDLILSDALNHACLIDGCRLSRAEIRVYRHADARHAREQMHDRERFRRCLLVTDGVFSMDGDLAPLPALCDLCEEMDVWLMVDDAHGIGVLGLTGAGSLEHFGLLDRVPIQMGTLSKALGSQGGFVAGSQVLIELLRNRARSFIYSTAPAPASVGAAIAALKVVQQEPEIRSVLKRNVSTLRTGLSAQGWAVPQSDAPILPIIVGEAEVTLQLADLLWKLGVWAPAIRPPTVPDGTARLRIGVTAAHSNEELARALAAFETAAGKYRLPQE